MNKQSVISLLDLAPHPCEGGYFKRTYTAPEKIVLPLGERNIMSSIYYMLSDDSPIGYMHRNRSDIVHYYHGGGALKYILLSPEGELSETVLGHNLVGGEKLQLLVPGGYWKASILLAGDYGLISEAVAPGFDPDDNELADREFIKKHFPKHYSVVEGYIKNK